MMSNEHGNNGRQVSRRKVLRVMAASGAGLMADGVKGSGRERAGGAGRIKQSIAYWCVQKCWSIEKTCQVARDLGCRSVELVEPRDWPTLKKYGLVCAIANSHWFDKGMNNPQYHEMCLGKLRESIDACADAGFPNVITFTGLAEGIGPELDFCHF
jgi:hydroxypyruvate isomerase